MDSLLEQILEKQPVADARTARLSTPRPIVRNKKHTSSATTYAPKPPSAKTIAEIIVIALLAFLLLLILFGFVQVILTGN